MTMYILESMIDLGKTIWPSNDHRIVAARIAICNPNVTTAEMLKNICEAVAKVPQNDIREITYQDLVDKFEMPDVKIFE